MMISGNSVAVLPFVNMSDIRENEYFSDGITEEIINALCRLDDLMVTSRTSSFAFKNQNTDIREIGRRLGVYYLLEGSVRRVGDRVRITAQLIKADNGFHMWSEKWDRELKDIFILQDEISWIIAQKINSGIKASSGQASLSKHSVHPDALDHYLKGLHLLNTFDHLNHQQMVEHFKKAIAIDPDFDRAYVGLCNSYTWLGSTGGIDPVESQKRVAENLMILMRLNPDTPEIYSLIAGKNFWLEWDLPRSLENINKALQLKPGFAEALVQKSIILMSMGRVEEAFACFFQAERLNPFDGVTTCCIGFLYNLINENSHSLTYLEKNTDSIALWSAHFFLYLEVLCLNGFHEKAMAIIAKKEQQPDFTPIAPYARSVCLSVMGEHKQAMDFVREKEIEIAANPALVSLIYYLCKICINAGEKEKAKELIKMAVSFRATPFMFYRIDHTFDEIRHDPEFITAMDSLNLKMEPLPAETLKYRKASLPESVVRDMETRLTGLMQKEKPYLNPQFTSPDLAALAGTTTNQLSQFLNENLGRNFYDYINSYRLKEFLTLYNKPGYKHLSILGLAYECGFNSKSTFNAFFKKEMGMTPSEYFKGKE